MQQRLVSGCSRSNNQGCRSLLQPRLLQLSNFMPGAAACWQLAVYCHMANSSRTGVHQGVLRLTAVVASRATEYYGGLLHMRSACTAA